MGVPKLIRGNGQEVPEKKTKQNRNKSKEVTKEANGFMSEGPGEATSFFTLH